MTDFVQKVDRRGRTWPQFVAGWILNENKWIADSPASHQEIGSVLMRQWLGFIDREEAKRLLRPRVENPIS